MALFALFADDTGLFSLLGVIYFVSFLQGKDA